MRIFKWVEYRVHAIQDGDDADWLVRSPSGFATGKSNFDAAIFESEGDARQALEAFLRENGGAKDHWWVQEFRTESVQPRGAG